MQFRVKNPKRNNTLLSVNGTIYRVGLDGVFDVEDDAAIEKLRRIPDEFVPLVVPVGAGDVAPPLKPKGGAHEFVVLVQTDGRVRRRLAAIHDDNMKLQFARAMGYEFTVEELAAAMAQATASVAPAAAPAEPAAPAPAAEPVEKEKPRRGKRK